MHGDIAGGLVGTRGCYTGRSEHAGMPHAHATDLGAGGVLHRYIGCRRGCRLGAARAGGLATALTSNRCAVKQLKDATHLFRHLPEPVRMSIIIGAGGGTTEN